MRIFRLDEMTINQIAAGEVVENTASVLKELLENSLDAGATQIQIDLLEGGRQLLRVADNGCGMSPKEVLVCLERHATSKLRNVSDLDELVSFGFRGEAIPSIASISRMRIISAEEGEDGFSVIVEGGQIAEEGPAAREQGTTIEVRDLFFNVPARLKFQKTPSADLAACTKVVKHLAIANPNVRITLRNSAEIIFDAIPTDTSIQGWQERCRQVLGVDWIRSKGLDLEEGPLVLRLIVLPAELHRANRSDQLVMLNRRVVQCPSIGLAVREAMAHRLDTGRYPAFLASLQLPPSWVDVNVHPQKREVRLRHEGAIRGLVARGTRCILEQVENPILEEHVQKTSFAAAIPQESIWNAWKMRTEARIDAEQNRTDSEELMAFSLSRAIVEGQKYGPSSSSEEIYHPEGSFSEVVDKRSCFFEAPQILLKIGDYWLVNSSEQGFWCSDHPGVWVVDGAALKRSYLQGVLSAEISVQTEPLLIPRELPLLPEEVAKTGCSRIGYEWTAVENGILITSVPSLFSLEEACQVLEHWVGCGELNRIFWQKAKKIGVTAVPPATLMQFQGDRNCEVTALGEKFRAWLSENELAAYLSNHGSLYKTFAPTEPN